MGSLDQASGSGIKRKIAVVDITGKAANQIEADFNSNYGDKGWRIIQAVGVGAKILLIAEKEL